MTVTAFATDSAAADEMERRLASLCTVSLIQAGKMLGIGKNRSYELAKVGEFPVTVRVIMGKYRVQVRDIEAYIAAAAI